MTPVKALLALASGALALASHLADIKDVKFGKDAIKDFVAEYEIYKFGWSIPNWVTTEDVTLTKVLGHVRVSGYYIYRDSFAFIKDDTLKSHGDIEILYFPFLLKDDEHLTIQVTITTPISEPIINSTDTEACQRDTTEQSNILICAMTTPIVLQDQVQLVVSKQDIEGVESWNFMVGYSFSPDNPFLASIVSFPTTDNLKCMTQRGETAGYTNKKEETCDLIPKSITKHQIKSHELDVILDDAVGIPGSTCYDKDALMTYRYEGYSFVQRGVM